ncbi:MAG TPA: hypothetical protein VK627_01825 [Edaphobacter sp.]|nr:hypothetical protein [Edaphobacter sp.]
MQEEAPAPEMGWALLFGLVMLWVGFLFSAGVLDGAAFVEGVD